MNEPCISLADEARYLHRRLFGFDPDPEVVDRYETANRLYNGTDKDEGALLATVVAKGLDPEAVEYALRLRDKNNPLTRKVRILFYLVEVRSRYYDFFFNSRGGWAASLFPLLAAIFVAARKLVVGNYLLRRNGLV